MLRLDELAELADAGAVDTVIVGFTDHYGRLMGKRFDAEFFLDRSSRDGTHACDYLLTVDMEMEPVARLRLRELGARLRRLPPRARPAHASRVASWLDRTALVLCDVDDDQRTTRRARSLRASILRAQIERAATPASPPRPRSELEYYLFDDTYRDAAREGLHRPRTGRLVHRGLPPPAGHAARALQRRACAATSTAPACPSRARRASGASASTSSTSATPTCSTMADRHAVFKQCHEGDRRRRRA